MTRHAAELSFQQTIARHSKSFALASKLLPPSVRRDALVLYAYCRRADDAVDLAPRAEQPAALAALRDELCAVYGQSGQAVQRDPITRAFAEVVRRHQIPRRYPEALLAGMAMDVLGMRYQRWADVQRYSYCVAGTVGRMMCHVMGVSDENALQHAEDLGIAMQLTNICRDVLEDWQQERLYLPADVLERHGAGEVALALGGPLPERAGPGLARAIEHVLDRADDFYRSGDAGLRYLSPRCRLAVHTARLVYSRIGDELRARGCDPRIGRVFVTTQRKLALAARAALGTLRAMAARSHLIVLGCALLLPLGLWLNGRETPAAAQAAQAANSETAGTLLVQLWNFKNDRGQALLAVFRTKQGFPDQVRHAIWSKALPIRNRRVDVTIEHVPAGTVALAMVHDEDKDFAIDTGLFGIPTEGYGASRDAPANFGPPKFHDAAFALGAGERKPIRIRVRY